MGKESMMLTIHKWGVEGLPLPLSGIDGHVLPNTAYGPENPLQFWGLSIYRAIPLHQYNVNYMLLNESFKLGLKNLVNTIQVNHQPLDMRIIRQTNSEFFYGFSYCGYSELAVLVIQKQSEGIQEVSIKLCLWPTFRDIKYEDHRSIFDGLAYKLDSWLKDKFDAKKQDIQSNEQTVELVASISSKGQDIIKPSNLPQEGEKAWLAWLDYQEGKKADGKRVTQKILAEKHELAQKTLEYYFSKFRKT